MHLTYCLFLPQKRTYDFNYFRSVQEIHTRDKRSPPCSIFRHCCDGVYLDGKWDWNCNENHPTECQCDVDSNGWNPYNCQESCCDTQCYG